MKKNESHAEAQRTRRRQDKERGRHGDKEKRYIEISLSPLLLVSLSVRHLRVPRASA
jgi:hypothetical protein